MAFITQGYKICTVISIVTAAAFFAVLFLGEDTLGTSYTCAVAALILALGISMLSVVSLSIGRIWSKALGADLTPEHHPVLFYFLVYGGFAIGGGLLLLAAMFALERLDLPTLSRWLSATARHFSIEHREMSAPQYVMCSQL